MTFQRENRYIVIKRKDLHLGDEEALRNLISGYHIPTRECLVIESDWPEYEPAWQMIQARMEGATPPSAQVQEYFPSDLLVSSVMNAEEVDHANFAAQVQGEQPEVVGVRYQAHGAGWELMDESPFADGRQNWKQGGEELQALMTVAQHHRIVAALESDWRRRVLNMQDTRNEVMRENAELRAALSAPPAAGVPIYQVEYLLDGGGGWSDVSAQEFSKYAEKPKEYRARVVYAGITPPAAGVPEDWREDVSLAAQMLTWGDDDGGLTERQISEIEQHAQKLFGMLAAAPTPPASEQQQAVVLPETVAWLYISEVDGEDWDIGVQLGDEKPNLHARVDGEVFQYAPLISLTKLLRLNPHLAGVNQGVTTEAGNGGDA